MNYTEFLKSKEAIQHPSGFDPLPMPKSMREDQKFATGNGIRLGRYCIFADCGLGKTIDEMEWARQIVELAGGPVIILAPLCVGTHRS